MKPCFCRSQRWPLSAVALVALVSATSPAANAAPAERLQYHPIRTDAGGKIVPWHSDDYGRAFDHGIRVVWKFWNQMAADGNGLPYYMNHQVWRPDLDDHRGIGGDQLQMALSSWALLYQYLGNLSTDTQLGNPPRFGSIVENMRFMADYYLSHGLSRPTDKWPHIPYPYNTLIYSGIYDGDMILGRHYTQPDKAGSFGAELVTLFKITEFTDYLDAAIAIADTLAGKIQKGDDKRSPLPFKVNAVTGELGKLYNPDRTVLESSYTTNWGGTLRLFDALIKLSSHKHWALDDDHGRPVTRFTAKRMAAYKRGFDTLLSWMKAYPLKNNRWGPFFEDINGWSDTQINAVTFAEFMMDYRELFPDWQTQVRGIFDWVERELGNPKWEKYGVVAINEQTAYRVPGNSHTSRQASAELRFAELTGDSSRKEMAYRRLAWATYHIDVDGKNRYIQDDVWLTDGYGDFVRHYLRAMASAPELAPSDQDHILRSTSVLQQVRYRPDRIQYRSFDAPAVDTLRLAAKPTRITLGGGEDITLNETPDLDKGQGWRWTTLKKGGLLQLRRDEKVSVTIYK